MKSKSRSVKRQARLAAIPRAYWLVGLVAVAVAVVVIYWGDPPIRDPNFASGNVLGQSDAPITITEYADFQCPACGQLARQTLPAIEEKYIKTGKVKWVFNHFAFLGDESIRAAEASECANDQGKFWEYANTLFNNQAGENHGTFRDEKLYEWAQQLGLNMDQFKMCMKDRLHLDEIQRSNNTAQSLKLPGTPSILVNGALVPGGSLAVIERALQPYLK
jgi:protein-disulfide isomerase